MSARNAYDVGDAGGGSINCSQCGKIHDVDLVSDDGPNVSEPMSLRGKLLFWAGLVAVVCVVALVKGL